MHKNVKRYYLAGEVKDDKDFPRLRSQYEDMLLRDMREAGYIPVLDLGTFWSTEYNAIDEKYNFVLTLYGVYVGRKRSWKVEGVSNGMEILRHIQKNK